jgi:hypothetical protein
MISAGFILVWCSATISDNSEGCCLVDIVHEVSRSVGHARPHRVPAFLPLHAGHFKIPVHIIVSRRSDP